MIQSYKELAFYLKADSLMSRFDTYSGTKSIFHINYRKKYLQTLRITEWLHNGRDKHLWMWLPYLFFSRKLDRLSYKCGFDIPLNTIGYGVNIPHHGSIIINSKAQIGNYCAIMNNVCIADSNPKKIGNGVLLGTSVVITKGISIADGVQIAAQSLINHSIENSCSVVGGIPQKQLKDKCLHWYYGDEETTRRYNECEKLRIKLRISVNSGSDE